MTQELLVAVDPGKNHAGVTVALNGAIVLCDTAKAKKAKDLAGPYYRQGRLPAVECALCGDVAQDVSRLMSTMKLDPHQSIELHLVGEIPMVRPPDPRKKRKNVNPEDLLFVQTTNAAIVGYFKGLGVLKTTRFIYPEEHKGQVTPEAYWQRVINEARKHKDTVDLIDEVLHSQGNKSGEPCDKVGHAIDSMGIAFWALWRTR